MPAFSKMVYIKPGKDTTVRNSVLGDGFFFCMNTDFCLYVLCGCAFSIPAVSSLYIAVSLDWWDSWFGLLFNLRGQCIIKLKQNPKQIWSLLIAPLEWALVGEKIQWALNEWSLDVARAVSWRPPNEILVPSCNSCACRDVLQTILTEVTSW